MPKKEGAMMHARLFVASVAALLVPCAASEAAEVLVDLSGHWRSYYTLRTPVYGTAAENQPDAKANLAANSPPPPPDWAKPDFDDSSWRHARGAPPTYPTLGLLCMRARFSVVAPERVEGLTLSARFHGGIVVYLNGVEVARRHLPDGDISPETLAEDYPADVYFGPGGAARALRFTELQQHIEKTARAVADMPVPAGLLREGVNALAIELHRAASHGRLPAIRLGYNLFPPAMFTSACLLEARLAAGRAEGVVPNTASPSGFRAWAVSTMRQLGPETGGDPNDPPRPIRLVGARNGVFSGQALVCADRPIEGLTASLSDLEGERGGAIPASSVRILYPLLSKSQPPVFDALSPVAPTAVQPARGIRFAVQPVWISVRVPGDAAPDEYRGLLVIRAKEAGPVKLDVHLTIADYRLPEPTDFVTLVDMVQSPETVAERYGARLWTDAHWKRLDRSFELLGALGNKVLYVPLIVKTYLGNAESMVYWVRDEDGAYRCDAGVMGRYLDAALKHMPRPRVVCLQVWDHYVGGSWADRQHHVFDGEGIGGGAARETAGVLVSRLDPATGAVQEIEGPRYEDAEAEAFWAPAAKAAMDCLRQRRLDKSVALGISGDYRVPKEAVELWRKLLPSVGWMSVAHFNPKTLYGQPFAYTTHVAIDCCGDPESERLYGWARKDLDSHYHRGMDLRSHLTNYRLLGELNLQSNRHGFGWIAADFWPVFKDKPITDRFRHLPRHNIVKAYAAYGFTGSNILADGPEGAEPTVRYEMMREGLQECEARLAIEKALLDEAARAKLGEDLAGRCRRTLDYRTRSTLWAFLAFHLNRRASVGHGIRQVDLGRAWYEGSGWQQQSKELYALAAEVAGALAGE